MILITSHLPGLALVSAETIHYLQTGHVLSANSVDPDQLASDLDLYCLPLSM